MKCSDYLPRINHNSSSYCGTMEIIRAILSKQMRPSLQFKNILVKTYSSTEQTTEDLKEMEIARIMKEASIDNPPTTCCGTGCANCVYIVWAEALTKRMEKEGPAMANKILERVDDQNMRAYLELELRIRLHK